MSSSTSDTLYLRLEGPLQAWGDNSKFVIRRTAEAPTKSGVLGLICCAMGLTRDESRGELKKLNQLRMGVRIDRPGRRWWDYHTVGAGYGVLSAEGKIKRTASTKEYETLVSRREYLCDASFLVALQSDDSALIEKTRDALKSPAWPVFLGRKSCPPSRPVFAGEGRCGGLLTALQRDPGQPGVAAGQPAAERSVECLIEWRPASQEPAAPAEAEVWYDAPVSFDPPVHRPRLVERKSVQVKVCEPTQFSTPPAPRPRADYQNPAYRRTRAARLVQDHHLCVFCKSPGPRMTAQHVTYRRAGGGETLDDLRSLCGLCHDAVTMLEYGLGMGLDRINPEEARWRDKIIEKRREIIQFRSLETRRRRLSAEEVE